MNRWDQPLSPGNDTDVARRGQAVRRQERTTVGVLLAAIGGFVDGVGYLVLFNLFTSHMSGNTIAAGVHFGTEDWGVALHRLFPVGVFVLGVVAGRMLAQVLVFKGFRSPFAAAFAAEAVLLLIFLLWGTQVLRHGGFQHEPAWVFYAMAALPTLAMGVQNATIRRVGGEVIRTTYITGGLTDLAEGAVDYLLWQRGLRGGQSPPSLRRVGLLGAIWAAYFLGAVLGALTEQRWQLPCLVLPIGCLVVLCGVDLALPFYRGEPAIHSPQGENQAHRQAVS